MAPYRENDRSVATGRILEHRPGESHGRTVVDRCEPRLVESRWPASRVALVGKLEPFIGLGVHARLLTKPADAHECVHIGSFADQTSELSLQVVLQEAERLGSIQVDLALLAIAPTNHGLTQAKVALHISRIRRYRFPQVFQGLVGVVSKFGQPASQYPPSRPIGSPTRRRSKEGKIVHGDAECQPAFCQGEASHGVLFERRGGGFEVRQAPRPTYRVRGGTGPRPSVARGRRGFASQTPQAPNSGRRTSDSSSEIRMLSARYLGSCVIWNKRLNAERASAGLRSRLSRETSRLRGSTAPRLRPAGAENFVPPPRTGVAGSRSPR